MRDQIIRRRRKIAAGGEEERRKKKKKKRSVLPYACRAAHRACNRRGWKGSSSQLALGVSTALFSAALMLFHPLALRRLRSEEYIVVLRARLRNRPKRRYIYIFPSSTQHATARWLPGGCQGEAEDGLDQARWPRTQSSASSLSPVPLAGVSSIACLHACSSLFLRDGQGRSTGTTITAAASYHRTAATAPDTAAGHPSLSLCFFLPALSRFVNQRPGSELARLTIGLGSGGGGTNLEQGLPRIQSQRQTDREREREIGTEEGAVCNSWQR
ncbi:uncharacterized protein ARB_04567 [Trichophyton benhamiae CBS 112371]|uniref:Transmembrane protein n=1 Tax=Arthroderma benhamiae (strain ATCC MYA-4681 / CBS 112371) TaxID=663331 RepID=D4AJW7_ARTBC|nr:uncharacterized protein ARB_04567 [Trichophyton benhamiae CBS 112371]EFE37040.1 hypothetical protein ARB_04567 [Trichophyton benhamiae CBS 112371]